MRRTAWWSSIVVQVWCMVLVSAVLVGGLILVNSHAEVAREREVVSANLHRFGSTAADTLAEDLSAEGTTVEQLANLASQSAISSAGSSCPAALEPVQRAVQVGTMVVLDARGRVVCSAASRSYTASGSGAFAGFEELRAAVAARKPSSGGPFTDPMTGDLSMFTQVPLPGAQASLVYVFGTQQTLSPLDPDPSTTSLVVDTRTGTVLMHFPEQDRTASDASTEASRWRGPPCACWPGSRSTTRTPRPARACGATCSSGLVLSSWWGCSG